MIDPERTARKGNLRVELWRRLFTAEVIVYRGALTVESRRCGYRDADRVFEETAARYGAQ